MLLFKVIIYSILSLSISISQVVLFEGLSIKVDTFIDSKESSSVVIELCKGKSESVLSCKGNVEVIDCKREPLDSNNKFQWDCLTKENYPYRVGLKIKNEIKYSSNNYQIATDSTRDRYALHLENDALETIKVPFDLFLEIGMQEMLENVFHPSVVQKIRELDKNQKNKSWSFIDNPETRMVLTSCQFSDCKKGKQAEVSCKFATLGIRAISYSCALPAFTRYLSFTIYGKDRIRKTEVIRFKNQTKGELGLNHLSLKSDRLEAEYDVFHSY